MRFFLTTLVGVITFFLLQGCADKKAEIYNKPALFWYKQIIKDIKDLDLEAADEHYTSMSSEHVASPLLEPMLLILAQAHMDNEEYLLANFYLDTYMKRYGTYAKNEYAKYMKIKANFMSFPYPNRNQELLLSTIKETKKYVREYPNGKYTPLVKTILVKMGLGKYYLDKRIEKLYKRIDRPKSVEVYEKILSESPLRDAKMIDPRRTWYREIFD